MEQSPMSNDDGESDSDSTEFSDAADLISEEHDDSDYSSSNNEAESPPHPLTDMDIVTTTTVASSNSPLNDAEDSVPQIMKDPARITKSTVDDKELATNDTPKRRRNKSVLEIYKEQSEEKETSARRIVSLLKEMYKSKVLPVEKRFYLHSFCLPTNGEIRDAEFEARPMVLLLGQYSTGKTSFIRHLLGGQDFPGIHIGPEPTTDKFMALVHGNENDDAVYDEHESLDFGKNREKGGLMSSGKIVKGNTLTVTPELPFASLAQFGSAFLQNFEGSVSSSPLLHKINLIDTPGVLSGEKQRLNREYDFAQVARWFADRSDLILLLFDAHKLDISDELKQVVQTIKPHNDDKIRCVLNKADSIDREELVRVYGSLMWSMGKMFHTPEVVRVYTGSYWDEPLVYDDFEKMFETDEWHLLNELINLPSVSVERKVNAMVKRIRLVKVHMCLLGYIRQQMPRWFGKEHAREKVLNKLERVFYIVQNKYKLSEGDMPNVDEFRKCLESFDDFSVFPSMERSALQQLDTLIHTDIPDVMKGSGGVTGVVESSQSSLATPLSPFSKSRARKNNALEMKVKNTILQLGMQRLKMIALQIKNIPRRFYFGLPVVLVLGIFVFLLFGGAEETSPEFYPH